MQRERERAAKKYDDDRLAVAVEAATLQAGGNPEGASIFQPAMMKAFPDDIYICIYMYIYIYVVFKNSKRIGQTRWPS